MQFFKDPNAQRWILRIGGLAILFSSVIPAFAASRMEIAAAGTLLIGWSLKAPGHEGA